MKLIKDLGLLFPSESSSQRYRYGIYECKTCRKQVKKQIRFVKKYNQENCRSCENKKNATIHGFYGHRLRGIYNKIKNRCYNKKNGDYKWYGAKGVTMCDEWLNDYQSFYDWSIANGHDDGLELDKDIICERDNIFPKIYSPETCMWVTKSINSTEATTRRYKNVKHNN
jgi:hypothetical protein